MCIVIFFSKPKDVSFVAKSSLAAFWRLDKWPMLAVRQKTTKFVHRLTSWKTINIQELWPIWRWRMFSLAISHALTNILRQTGRSWSRSYVPIFKRAASSKHPRGFAPPTADDLTELRERVQEFTSIRCNCMSIKDEADCRPRTRNSRRACREDRPR